MFQGIFVAARSGQCRCAAMHPTFLPLTAGAMQGLPERVLAPQRALESIAPLFRGFFVIVSVCVLRHAALRQSPPIASNIMGAKTGSCGRLPFPIRGLRTGARQRICRSQVCTLSYTKQKGGARSLAHKFERSTLEDFMRKNKARGPSTHSLVPILRML